MDDRNDPTRSGRPGRDGRSARAVSVTRIINPCALIELGGVASVLTDPYFEDHRWFPMIEPIGLAPSDLPPLDAILGGHAAFDHWQPQSMRAYRHHAETAVFVATKGMARRARHSGFDRVEVLRWGERRRIHDDLVVTCLPGERPLGVRTNNYLVETPEVSVYVGTEARSLEPVERCATHHRVDAAVLPIDGLTFLGRRLVMDAEAAVRAARTLGARHLFPIHCSQRPVAGVIRCPSGVGALRALAEVGSPVAVHHAPTGTALRVEV
ncbi:MAG: MBL fold metallo-hydrolase [Acidimicrobiales bacterium]|nr:MBL fold metallo-hydrolase [Acidimicrobiales bacterium]